MHRSLFFGLFIGVVMSASSGLDALAAPPDAEMLEAGKKLYLMAGSCFACRAGFSPSPSSKKKNNDV